MNKRKYKRIEKPYIARLRIKQYEGLGKPSAEWDMVTVKDLSAGGALFYYSKYLGLDSLLDFKIDISKYTPAINCVGEITRIDKPRSTSMFGISIKFTEIDEQEKAMINTTVEKALE